jgi:hypothetical protein
LGSKVVRVLAKPEVFTEWLATQSSSIEYSNFKSRVSQTRGYEYVDALHEVWAAMLATAGKD